MKIQVDGIWVDLFLGDKAVDTYLNGSQTEWNLVLEKIRNEIRNLNYGELSEHNFEDSYEKTKKY